MSRSSYKFKPPSRTFPSIISPSFQPELRHDINKQDIRMHKIQPQIASEAKRFQGALTAGDGDLGPPRGDLRGAGGQACDAGAAERGQLQQVRAVRNQLPTKAEGRGTKLNTKGWTKIKAFWVEKNIYIDLAMFFFDLFGAWLIIAQVFESPDSTDRHFGEQLPFWKKNLKKTCFTRGLDEMIGTDMTNLCHRFFTLPKPQKSFKRINF